MSHVSQFVARLSQFGPRLKTRLFGVWVGTDAVGNNYYHSRKQGADGRESRWVLFAGEVEASSIPPVWRCWLQHMWPHQDLLCGTNSLLQGPPVNEYVWQKMHVPNLTGSVVSCLPFGHGLRNLTGRDYKLMTREPWAWVPPADE